MPISARFFPTLRGWRFSRITQFMVHQTLRLSFFAFYGLSDRDYMLNPEVKYNLTDSVWIALGGNVFGGGKPWTQFGQFAREG